MINIKGLFHHLDEDKRSIVRFGDGSIVKYEGKGSILVKFLDVNSMELENVLSIPNLKVNILSLKKSMTKVARQQLGGSYLTMYNELGGFTTKVLNSNGCV